MSSNDAVCNTAVALPGVIKINSHNYISKLLSSLVMKEIYLAGTLQSKGTLRVAPKIEI